MQTVYLWIVLFPLLGAIIAGLFGRKIGRAGAHWVTIIGVGLSFLLSLVVLKHHVIDGNPDYNGAVYTWLVSGGITMEIGFLVDGLTAVMVSVVSFVSFMVHIYTIGYMHDDPGYQRFFSYISLFTFSMLMLVMSNNFLQLFFGWEAVGLISYLLIGFWYTRSTAIFASLKAFLVNRVGDFGFLLGVAVILMYFDSLDYATVFAAAPSQADTVIPLFGGSHMLTVACILLFIGAMGKSAQVPLHVWLPDSMEGPTPISALIHAATMVTAGIFMVARMTPLFEQSTTALSVVLIIGAITALFMGFLGMVNNDIKRVIAYSTLSQLGYMTVALGAGAYSVAIFHLMTHAFFKALLFLAAGSVIIALHHEQNIWKMGGLRKYMPITWITSLIGTLALIGTPFFAGFYSKDSILEAVHLSHTPGHTIAFIAVLLGVFVTSFYSFRLYFVVFHGQERFDTDSHHDDHHGDDHHGGPPHETPAVVTVPLILLAIPSVIIGALTIGPMLYGDVFASSINQYLTPERNPLHTMAEEYHGPVSYALHSFYNFTIPAFWLALAGAVSAWYLYIKRPELPGQIQAKLAQSKPLAILQTTLDQKYWFDYINERYIAAGGRALGRGLWKYSDAGLIDGVVVNGAAKTIGWLAGVVRRVQSGYLYHYAFAMIIGLLGLLTWVVS